MYDVNEVQKLFAVWRRHVVQVEVDIVACIPEELGA